MKTQSENSPKQLEFGNPKGCGRPSCPCNPLHPYNLKKQENRAASDSNN